MKLYKRIWNFPFSFFRRAIRNSRKEFRMEFQGEFTILLFCCWFFIIYLLVWLISHCELPESQQRIGILGRLHMELMGLLNQFCVFCIKRDIEFHALLLPCSSAVNYETFSLKSSAATPWRTI